MFVIETETAIIYPVAFNSYLRKLKKNNIHLMRMEEERLDESAVCDIQSDIKECDTRKIIVIDFQKILVKDNRNFDIFLELQAKKLIFTNLSLETAFFERVATDLEIDEELQKKEQKTIYSNMEVLKEIENKKNVKVLSQVYQDHIAKLIEQCMEPNGERDRFLESSCVFSDKYANIKKVFNKPQECRFLLYCLACNVKEIMRSTRNLNLICTSKTGAIIANILSQMLDIPVTFCAGVGPRFAVKPDEIAEKVQENKRYIYVFDFLCLGTELKILSTFVSNKKAKLIGGVGPASYIRCDHGEIVRRKLILGKMRPLINVQDYPEIGYFVEIPN